jgi:hypothetical protein
MAFFYTNLIELKIVLLMITLKVIFFYFEMEVISYDYANRLVSSYILALLIRLLYTRSHTCSATASKAGNVGRGIVPIISSPRQRGPEKVVPVDVMACKMC